ARRRERGDGVFRRERLPERDQQRLVRGDPVLVAVVGVPQRQERGRRVEAVAQQRQRQRVRRAQRGQVVGLDRERAVGGAGLRGDRHPCPVGDVVGREVRLRRVVVADRGVGGVAQLRREPEQALEQHR